SKRMSFAPDKEDIPVHAGFNKLVSHAHPINKTRTLIAYIKRSTLPFRYTEHALGQNSTTRKIIVRTESSEYDEIDIIRLNSGATDCLPGSFHSHSGGGFLEFGYDVTFDDPGSFTDPSVIRIHD